MIHAHLLLAMSILILSQAGNIIRFCDATPDTVAFLRLTLAFFIVIPFCLGSFFRRRNMLGKRQVLQLFGMGALFALHFLTWISAVQNTTVANAAIFFGLSPLFTTLGARSFFREQLHPRIFYTIILGVVGVAVIGYSDLSLTPRHLWGDALGLISGILFSAYFLVGKSARIGLDNRVVMPAVYGFGALCLLPWQISALPKILALSSTSWIAALVLAVFPTILGHATMIYLTRQFRASTLGAATLIEPVFAGAGALILFGEVLQPLVFVGYGVITLGLLLIVKPARIPVHAA